MPRSNPVIAIEKEFDHCVRQTGGIKISDIVGSAPDFLNADYLFNEYDIIAELKCLEDDKIKDNQLRDKTSKIYERYLKEGKAPVVVFGEARLSTEGFPDEFRQEIGELYRLSIHSVIKKANQQIRQTKEKLKKESSHGLLILVNDGHTILEPAHAMWVLRETFKRYSFSSIDSVIYFTANQRAEIAGINKDILVWIQAHRSPENKCPNQLLDRLKRNWLKHFEDITGEPVAEIIASDSNLINEIKNI